MMVTSAHLQNAPEQLRCWYFLSYSRGDQSNPSPDRDAVGLFHRALHDALLHNGRNGLDAMGFWDRGDIDLGKDWKDVLLAALRGCRTFIPLLSQQYFEREFCGQEWAAFEGRATGQPLILPLIWAKSPGRPFPAFAESLQETLAHGDLTARDLERLEEYRRIGLRRVLNGSPNDNDMREVLNVVADAVARKIVERHQQYPLGMTNGLRQLPRAKFGGTPQKQTLPAAGRSIHVGVAAGSKSEMVSRRGATLAFYPSDADRDWTPYAPQDYATISQYALEAARSQRLDCSWLPVRAGNLVQTIRDLEVPAREEPVLLLVDPWSVDIPELSLVLSSIDEQRFKNCVVVVIWSFAESEDGSTSADPTRQAVLRQAVRSVFQRSYPANAEEATREFIANVNEASKLRSVLVTWVRDLSQLAATGRVAMRPVPQGSLLVSVQAQ